MRAAGGPSGQRFGAASGLTLIELVVAAALLAILATAALPLYEVSVRREREVELKVALRMLRRSIDDFHKSYCASGGAAPDCGLFASLPKPGGAPGGTGTAPATAASGSRYLQVPLIDYTKYDPVDTKGYPPNLEELLAVKPSGGTDDEEEAIRFLRRRLTDPMLPRERIENDRDNWGWGVRCYQDGPDSTSWCRKNIYDVYTKSTGKALDGSKYRDW